MTTMPSHAESAAELVRAVQQATGWTEQQIADEIGVSQATVHRAKSGGNISFAIGQRLTALRDRHAGEALERERLRWWRASLPYIHRHRHGVFVLLLPDEVLRPPKLGPLAQDIALLSGLGARLLLVYDAAPRIAERLGRKARWHNGRLLVPSESLDTALAATSVAGIHLTAQLSSGMPRSAMHGARLRVRHGNAVVGRPLGVMDGIDMQRAGAVRRINADDLREQLGEGCVLLLPPLGYSPSGEVFCLDAGELAAEAAAALRADKLIAFCGAPGALDGDGALISELTVADAERMLDGAASGAAAEPRWLGALCDAVRRGAKVGHLVSYAEDDALLRELFTDAGAGTIVRQRLEERIRQAQPDDIAPLLGLIGPLERQGVLAPRPRAQIEAELDCFLVLERDGEIVGCAALYPWLDERSGEVAGVATHPDHRRAGYATRLLAELERRARQQRMDTVFALSATALHWFEERGFEQVGIDALPVGRQRLYNYQRNSKVFVKRLR